ncbi:hypothetical protein ASD52_36420 [Ensifer sp. Root142]|nr:hypothetical protein ASD52_36420 [Ensifer sp. Root142]
MHYDAQRRLISITDALGRDTTFTYGLPDRPLLITKITDPFGRKATLTYDSYGRLSSLTDIIGLTSSFTYDVNSLVNGMATPYGTTTFAYTAPGTVKPRFVQVTDPLGYKEREEWLEPAPIPASDPASTVPVGMPLPPSNSYLTYRNSFHWDKDAYAAAGCTDAGGCDYTKARLRHFVHMPGASIKGTAIESSKTALEGRVWFNYPGQKSSAGSLYGGTYNRPVAVGRVLDDGTTQISKFEYDEDNFFNLTKAVDPIGRTTNYSYSNGIDLVAISQTSELGAQSTLAQYVYNGQHRPIFYMDAAGRTSTYIYNPAGQLTSVTNPLGEKTTYAYDVSGNISTITNANSEVAASYTYDDFARVRTFTDSEGWVVTADYDAADRITNLTYPDGTSERFIYDKLDLASYRDREGRLWKYEHDANHRLTKVIQPSGKEVSLGYNSLDQVVSLTDPNLNETAWSYDLQGRPTGKQYADGRTEIYAYEQTISRLTSITDALNQVKQISYAADNKPLAINYLNVANPTPNVALTYDPFFLRVASMTDGSGTTRYSYRPMFEDGALQLEKECFTATGETSCAHQIDYAYDELGRPKARTIEGSGAETLAYDAINRVAQHNSDLGAFAFNYLGQTSQVTRRSLAITGSNLSTSWTYLGNSNDRRLASISNKGLAPGQFTDFAFTTTPENRIVGIMQSSDASVLMPNTDAQTAAFNEVNQLTSLSGQAFEYDANGNLLSDGTRSFTWDAENRLIGVSYPAEPGRAVAYAYDGLGRRISITSTPAGGSPSDTRYVWCGSTLCQARDASNELVRGYYPEGELVKGATDQPLYYGVDQIGSVRRVFASPIEAPVYDYDPFGVSLQSAAKLTDFGYAGMFTADPGGNYLTWYRAYAPVIGRWLSRDPIGEDSDPAANLYVYASLDPLGNTDPLGLFPRPSPGGAQCGNLPSSPDKTPIQPAGSPRTGEPWGMWTNGYDTTRMYDGGGNAWYDIDRGHHGRGWEYHMWENGVRQPGVEFEPGKR